jgi:hypothetical protein
MSNSKLQQYYLDGKCLLTTLLRHSHVKVK